MSSKSFNEVALEFLKIYYTCHPQELPKDRDKAFKEMMQLHSKIKNELIEKDIKKNKDFFRDQF
ncbi:MAG: hypothetical protein KDI06_22985 [Calditrichaeota bacterium]|nr:hypothetical protein [Calditrichota bacterium]HQU73907.1 hypothetical protein [Calditrichia bacterium]